MSRNFASAVIASLLLIGCTPNKPVPGGESFATITQGQASGKYDAFKPEEARLLDVFTPILNAKENGAEKISTINSGYTGQLNGAVVAAALKNIVSDSILTTGAALSSGPGDCPSCRALTSAVNGARFSIFVPSVGYSKSITVIEHQSFADASKPLLDEISIAMNMRGCVPIPGNPSYRTDAPVSDSKTYFIGKYVCPVPESVKALPSISNMGAGSTSSKLLGVLENGRGPASVIHTVVIVRDEANSNLLHASIHSNCGGLVHLARGLGRDIHRAEWDACKGDSLALSVANGWSVITSRFSPDDSYKTLLDIHGPTWSGTVESPFQNQAIAQHFYN